MYRRGAGEALAKSELEQCSVWDFVKREILCAAACALLPRKE